MYGIKRVYFKGVVATDNEGVVREKVVSAITCLAAVVIIGLWLPLLYVGDYVWTLRIEFTLMFIIFVICLVRLLKYKKHDAIRNLAAFFALLHPTLSWYSGGCRFHEDTSVVIWGLAASVAILLMGGRIRVANVIAFLAALQTVTLNALEFFELTEALCPSSYLRDRPTYEVTAGTLITRFTHSLFTPCVIYVALREFSLRIYSSHQLITHEKVINEKLLHVILPRHVGEVLQSRLRMNEPNAVHRSPSANNDGALTFDKRRSTFTSLRQRRLAVGLVSPGHAEELYDFVVSEFHPSATIMFADIEGFTAAAARSSPEELVLRLNALVQSIDKRCMNLGIDKIKTIGDCYMCVGLPIGDDSATACESVLRLAWELRSLIELHPPFRHRKNQFRVGVHTGPIQAGVIGYTRIAYDVWGDAVNQASRLESSGIPGRIQTSEEVRETMYGRATFTSRGLIDMKGKGPVPCFLLDGFADTPDIITASSHDDRDFSIPIAVSVGSSTTRVDNPLDTTYH